MRRKRRMFILLPAVILVLAGCGSSKSQNTVLQPKPIETQVPETESGEGTKEQTGETESNVSEAPTEEKLNEKPETKEESSVKKEDLWAKAPVISYSEWIDNRYLDEGDLLVEGTCRTVEVSGEGYEAVSAAVKGMNGLLERNFAETVDQYEEFMLDAQDEEVIFPNFTTIAESSVTRADRNVISMKRYYYDFAGGAHGNYGTAGLNFDAQTGSEISFWDLTENRKVFYERSLAYCLAYLEKEYGEEWLFSGYEDAVKEAWDEEPNWYLDASGVTVIFNPYELGPFALGELFVTLPYTEFEDLIRPRYLMGANGGFAVMSADVTAQPALGKNTGKTSTLRLYPEETSQEAGIGTWFLEIGGQAVKAAEFDRLVSSYVLQREDGRSFLLFDGDMASDDYVTYVYEITDGDVKKTFESKDCTSILEGSLTPQGSMKLAKRLDALGTYTVVGDFVLTEEGTLEAVGDRYIVEGTYESHILTVLRDLPVTVNGTQALLPAGSSLRITGTDMKGVLQYHLLEQDLSEETFDVLREGEIHYTRKEGDYRIYIGDVPETEYFENLPYAG